MAKEAKYENFAASAREGFINDKDAAECYEGKDAVLFSALESETGIQPWIESYLEDKYETLGETHEYIKPGTFPQFLRAVVAAGDDGVGSRLSGALQPFSKRGTLTVLPTNAAAIKINATEEKLTLTGYSFDADCLIATYDGWVQKGLVKWNEGELNKVHIATKIVEAMLKDDESISKDKKKAYWECLTMTEVRSLELSKADFADGVIPSYAWIALQGGGGAGGTGQTFAGDDGDGGGAGGFLLACVKIERNKEYYAFAGGGGSGVNSPGARGNDGGDAPLFSDGERLCAALGGKGGGGYKSPGEGGSVYAPENTAINAVITQSGGKGGDGDSPDGKGGSVCKQGASSYKKELKNPGGDGNENVFFTPGGDSPESLAKGSKGFTGSGGGSAFGDGGAGGRSGTEGYGLAGVNGSGGGGGRYLFAGWNKGGDGGDGLVMIIC